MEKDESAKELGAAIRARRKSLKLTQEQLGNFAGCGVAFIYLLENGKSTVRIDKLLDVLDVLGLQLTLEAGKNRIEIDGGLS